MVGHLCSVGAELMKNEVQLYEQGRNSVTGAFCCWNIMFFGEQYILTIN